MWRVEKIKPLLLTEAENASKLKSNCCENGHGKPSETKGMNNNINNIELNGKTC